MKATLFSTQAVRRSFWLNTWECFYNSLLKHLLICRANEFYWIYKNKVLHYLWEESFYSKHSRSTWRTWYKINTAVLFADFKRRLQVKHLLPFVLFLHFWVKNIGQMISQVSFRVFNWIFCFSADQPVPKSLKTNIKKQVLHG